VAAGASVKLTVHLEGQGTLAQALAPDLERKKNFNQQFRVRLDKDRRVSEQFREYTYVLRPYHSGVTEIPAVAIVVFNPKLGGYETLKTEPIPLTVTGAETAKAEEDIFTHPETPPESDSSADLGEEQAAGSSRAKQMVLAALIALATLLTAALAVWAVRRAQRRSPAASVCHGLPTVPPGAWRGQEATPQHAMVPSPPPIGSVRRTLFGFLRQRYGMTAGELTPVEVGEHLRERGVREELVQRTNGLLRTLAAAEFAPGLVTDSHAALAAAAADLMRLLDRARDQGADSAFQYSGSGAVTVTGS